MKASIVSAVVALLVVPAVYAQTDAAAPESWNFDQLDINKSESLDLSEVSVLGNPQYRFNYADTNRDKKLSRGEWEVAVNQKFGEGAGEGATGGGATQ